MIKVHEFLESNQRNAWLHCDDKDVYVRRGIHRHPDLGRILNCFDIANITVHEPGKGTFSRWFDDLKPIMRAAGFDAIYIESACPRFADHLYRKGLYEVRTDIYDVSFFYCWVDE